MIAITRRRILTPVGGVLPSGYTQLQYVDNQGAAYCDTGIAVTGDMTFDVNFLIYTATSTSHYSLFGGGGNPTQTRSSVGFENRGNSLGDCQFIYRIGHYLSPTLTPTLNDWHNVELKSDGFYYDGSLAWAITRTSFTGANFWLGCYSYRTAIPAAYLHIGICTINNYQFIPAKRIADGEVGFYCPQTSTFYTSATATPFAAPQT